MTGKRILVGFYVGLGDILAVVPAIRQLAAQGNRVIVAASPLFLELRPILELPSDGIDWICIETMKRSSIVRILRLLNSFRGLSPDLVCVSPHADVKVASWKLPLLLKLLRLFFWRKTKVMGSSDEPFAALFDERLPIVRRQPLADREWELHRLAGTVDRFAIPDRRIFKTDLKDSERGYDVLIHVGASKPHKRWPAGAVIELCHLLGDQTRIGLLGLPQELEEFSTRKLPLTVEMRSASLTESIQLVAAARCVVTMDSGFSHIAAALRRPHLALFGPTDPIAFRPLADTSRVVIGRRLACQPCNRHTCSYTRVHCMESIDPSEVAGLVWKLLNGDQRLDASTTQDRVEVEQCQIVTTSKNSSPNRSMTI